MRYEDVIARMERNGDYSSAQEYRDSLMGRGISEYDSVDKYNPADGAQYTYAGDRAEEAYRDLIRQERREEERWEQEEAERQYYEQQQREQEEQAYLDYIKNQGPERMSLTYE